MDEKYGSGRPDCRILFSDIDGTLLNSHHQVPENTRKKILELEQQGIPFILVSARMPQGVRVVQKLVGNHSPIVCYSGGLVLDERGNVLHSCQIPLKQALSIKESLKRFCPDICCNTYGMDQWVVDDDRNPWVVREERITEGKSVAGDVETCFAGDQGIHKFLLMGEREAVTKAARMLGEAYPDLTVQRSNENYLEVMNGAVEKSVGVQVLCRYYGIPESRAAAFGDGENDLPMLLAVGYGFAMANGLDVVKKQAPYLTGSNDEEGILQALTRLDPGARMPSERRHPEEETL